MNIIEELYYGNVRPNGGRCIDDPQYRKAIKTLDKSEEMLRNRLSPEDINTFNDFANAASEVNALENIDNFKVGFALDALLMIDCIKEGKALSGDI